MTTKTKVEPLVHLNTNPCKMCMPMGAVTALYGIKGCMTLLHGSQGCSTYIRRHMATHYNEPVDVASSSLTEQGTVYGGEENLLKGLSNLIELYHPEVIGVATTCLAETIGEDIRGIIDTFYRLHKEHEKITIIPIHTAGYGGTQFDGYFAALYSMVSQVKMHGVKHHKINVITGMLSPADTRYLKQALALFDLEPILLPDPSENLDNGFSKTYQRLPKGGTPIEAIREMAGARFTLQLGNIPSEKSPAHYLYEMYGVPYKEINMPMGLRDTDAFYKELAQLSGKEIPQIVQEARGRYLDAMIDGHKYNGEGRAVLYGDPDFIVSTVRLCTENGILPVVVATGSECKAIKALVGEEIALLAEKYFIEDTCIIDDTDFKMIEALAKTYKANLLIGNSDGRRIEEKLNIPLVRRGFPIHDRVGGQRLKTLGYEGSLLFLDEMTNALLAEKEGHFREHLFKTYFKEDRVEDAKETLMTKEMIEEKTKTHPCYNCGAHDHARMHLPIAPRCNIQCNYCVRKFDCPNESRPGVVTKVLTPEEAFERFKEVKAKMPNLSVVGIAGPGDALANFEETKKTLTLIKAYDPNITFCLSTNGLMLPFYVQELISLGVTHVTVTVNAINPKIGAQIYHHIEYMGMHFEGEMAASMLLANQMSGLRMLVERGVICKVNIVTLKGINDTHIPEIVEKMKALGCYMTNIMPLIPVKGSAFEGRPVANNKEVQAIRKLCGETMKQMYHCRQCRADAIGTLQDDQLVAFASCEEGCHSPKPIQDKKYRFAVASKSGMIVDQHFGHIKEVSIYEYHNDEIRYIEKREIEQYCKGKDSCGEKEDKIEQIIKCIEDCEGVLALRTGLSPTEKLKQKGISVFTTCERIHDAIKAAAIELAKTS